MDWESVKYWGKIVLAIAPWIGSVFYFHTWAYNKYPKYYFTVVRLFSKWRDTKWNVTVNFWVDDISSTYVKIENALRSRYPSNYRRPVNMVNKKVYECGNYMLIVTDEADMSPNGNIPVTIKFQQLNVTLNNAEAYLRDLRELFHSLELDVHPRRRSYNMDVFFPSKQNPFFGLMIQRLGPDKVNHFECVFPINTLISRPEEDVIGSSSTSLQENLRVFKDKITINECSFDRLEKVAIKSLLLR